MNREPSEILSAFLDGEAVDERALAEALTAPGGRETLVDFVLLRAAATNAADRPGEEFYRRMDPALAPPRRRAAWPVVAAAAAVVTFAALGLWALFPQSSDAEPPQPIPAASRTLHFERGVDWQGQG